MTRNKTDILGKILSFCSVETVYTGLDHLVTEVRSPSENKQRWLFEYVLKRRVISKMPVLHDSVFIR